MLESRFNRLLNKVDNIVRMKSRWLWLVGLLLIISLSGITQNQGYSWTLGSAPPFNSTPAIAGSTGTHQLTTIGDGDPAIAVVSENIGLGTSCTAPINVGAYMYSGVLRFFYKTSALKKSLKY